MSEKEINHSDTDEAVCPYCGYEFSDSWEFFHDDDGVTGTDIQCNNCNKTFFCELVFDITYTSSKKDGR